MDGGLQLCTAGAYQNHPQENQYYNNLHHHMRIFWELNNEYI